MFYHNVFAADLFHRHGEVLDGLVYLERKYASCELMFLINRMANRHWDSICGLLNLSGTIIDRQVIWSEVVIAR